MVTKECRYRKVKEDCWVEIWREREKETLGITHIHKSTGKGECTHVFRSHKLYQLFANPG